MTNKQTPTQPQNRSRETAGEFKVDLQNKKAKDKYRVRNWASCNESLKKRGSITLWIDEDVLRAWRPDAKAPKKRGGQQEYSDGAIECLLLVKPVYHLGDRQTEGFAASLTKFLGIALPIPDYTTLNRRAKVLKVDLPSRQKGPVGDCYLHPFNRFPLFLRQPDIPSSHPSRLPALISSPGFVRAGIIVPTDETYPPDPC